VVILPSLLPSFDRWTKYDKISETSLGASLKTQLGGTEAVVDHIVEVIGVYLPMTSINRVYIHIDVEM
jgi:hypothetical protein